MSFAKHAFKEFCLTAGNTVYTFSCGFIRLTSTLVKFGNTIAVGAVVPER